MTACGPLCALMTGGVGFLAPPCWFGPVWAAVPAFSEDDSEALGPFPRDEGMRQEKALALLLRLGGHFRPQCGRFRELELALF